MYSLKWGNHEKSLAQAFKRLKSDGGFCDASIACEDRILETHKLILATSSSVFSNILRHYSHPHPMIYLRGIKASDMDALLEFMYCGEVQVKEDKLESFLAAAEELKVEGLVNNQKKFQDNVRDQISPDWKMPIDEILQSSVDIQTFRVAAPLSSAPIPFSSTTCEELLKISPSNMVCQPTEQRKLNSDESSSKRAITEPPAVSAFIGEQGQYQLENGDKQISEMDQKPPESVKHLVKEWKDLKNFVVLGERVKYGNGHKKLSQCTLCGKTNINRSRLLAHIKSGHFRKAFKFTCAICGKSQGTRTGSMAHIKRCQAKRAGKISHK